MNPRKTLIWVLAILIIGIIAIPLLDRDRQEVWITISLLIGLWLAITLDTFPGVLIGLATVSICVGGLFFFNSINFESLAFLGSRLGIGWLVGGIIWEIVDKVQGKPRRQKTSPEIRGGLILIIIPFGYFFIIAGYPVMMFLLGGICC